MQIITVERIFISRGRNGIIWIVRNFYIFVRDDLYLTLGAPGVYIVRILDYITLNIN